MLKLTTSANPSARTPEIRIDNIGERVASLWQWLVNHSLEIAIAAGVGALIFFALNLLRGRARAFAEKQHDRLSLAAIIGRTLAKTGRFFILMVAARLVVGFAEAPQGLFDLVRFLFTIAAVLQAAIWVREVVLGLIERRAMLSEDNGSETLANAMTLIKVLVSVVVFSIAAIMVLDNLGVNVTGLIAGLGIGGIAIGLAAQGIFSDLFAALSIIFDRPFKRGETIGYDNTTANVEKIGLKSTRLRSLTGEQVIISNTNLLSKEITNFSRLDRRRTRYGIGLIYQTPPEQARAVPALLKEIVEAEGAVFVRAGFTGFGASSIDLQLDFDVMSAEFETVFEARHRIGLAILDRFNAEGLEFAYPTQTTFTAAPDGKMVMPYPGFVPAAVTDERAESTG